MLRGFLNQGFNVQVQMQKAIKPGVAYTVNFSGPSAGPDEITIAPTNVTLHFDSTNWNVLQNLGVTGHRFGTIPINYELLVNYTGKTKKSSFSVFIDDILPNTVIATDAGYLTTSDPNVGELSFLLVGSYFTIQSLATAGIRPTVTQIQDSSSGDGGYFFVHTKPDGTMATGFPTVNADGIWTVYVCHYPNVYIGFGTPPSAIGSYNLGITVKITDPLSGTVMSHDSIVSNVSCGVILNEVGFTALGNHVNINAGTAFSYSDTYTDTFCHLVQGPNVWSTSDTSPESFSPLPYTTGSIADPTISTGSTASVSISFSYPMPPPHSPSNSFTFDGAKGGISIRFSGAIIGSIGVSSPIYSIITPAVP